MKNKVLISLLALLTVLVFAGDAFALTGRDTNFSQFNIDVGALRDQAGYLWTFWNILTGPVAMFAAAYLIVGAILRHTKGHEMALVPATMPAFIYGFLLGGISIVLQFYGFSAGATI